MSQAAHGSPSHLDEVTPWVRSSVRFRTEVQTKSQPTANCRSTPTILEEDLILWGLLLMLETIADMYKKATKEITNYVDESIL